MDWSSVSRAWRDHSLSIVGLSSGTLIIAASSAALSTGKLWDVCSTIGAILLGKGLEGPLYSWWREVRKAED